MIPLYRYIEYQTANLIPNHIVGFVMKSTWLRELKLTSTDHLRSWQFTIDLAPPRTMRGGCAYWTIIVPPKSPAEEAAEVYLLVLPRGGRRVLGVQSHPVSPMAPLRRRFLPPSGQRLHVRGHNRLVAAAGLAFLRQPDGQQGCKCALRGLHSDGCRRRPLRARARAPWTALGASPSARAASVSAAHCFRSQLSPPTA